MSCRLEAKLSSIMDTSLEAPELPDFTPSLRIRDQLKVCLRFSLKA